MKPTTNIWLNEYEGLLAVPSKPNEPAARPQSPVERRKRVVGPHFTLTPIDLENATSIALFE